MYKYKAYAGSNKTLVVTKLSKKVILNSFQKLVNYIFLPITIKEIVLDNDFQTWNEL